MNQTTSSGPTLHFSREVTAASKGAAVILMLIHHLFYCCPGLTEQYHVTSKLFSLKQIYLISEVSKICVAVFVFLTAYGMTAGGADKKPDTLRRVKRLILSFWVVYVMSVCTYFLRPDHFADYLQDGWTTGFFYPLFDAFGLSNMLGTPQYNETWWYITLALLLIFLLPMVIALYKRYGICILGVSAFIPYMVDARTGGLYLFAAVLGIWAADSSFFPQLKQWTSKRSIVLPFLGSCLLFAVFCTIRIRIGLTYWTDALLAFFLITAVFLLVDCTPLKLPVLVFLGKYSMNIFFVHTLLFKYYFTRWIYAPGNWLLISLLLLVSSLAVSLVLTPIQSAVLRRFCR